jgi:hypothetical protein
VLQRKTLTQIYIDVKRAFDRVKDLQNGGEGRSETVEKEN